MRRLVFSLIFLFLFLFLIKQTSFAQPLLKDQPAVNPDVNEQQRAGEEEMDRLDTNQWDPQQWNQFMHTLPEALENLEKRLTELENKKVESQPAVRQEQEKDDLWNTLQKWFRGWWKWGLIWGFLWWIPWFVYSWQWWRRRFWCFIWPWPWWWWLPWFWFIPWLWWGWWWHPFCFWYWWCFLWWWIPWIFWLPWWLIILKHVLQDLHKAR